MQYFVLRLTKCKCIIRNYILMELVDFNNKIKVKHKISCNSRRTNKVCKMLAIERRHVCVVYDMMQSAHIATVASRMCDEWYDAVNTHCHWPLYEQQPPRILHRDRDSRHLLSAEPSRCGSQCKACRFAARVHIIVRWDVGVWEIPIKVLFPFNINYFGLIFIPYHSIYIKI